MTVPCLPHPALPIIIDHIKIMLICMVDPWSGGAKLLKRASCPIYPIYTKFRSLPKSSSKIRAQLHPFQRRGITH